MFADWSITIRPGKKVWIKDFVDIHLSSVLIISYDMDHL